VLQLKDEGSDVNTAAIVVWYVCFACTLRMQACLHAAFDIDFDKMITTKFRYSWLLLFFSRCINYIMM